MLRRLVRTLARLVIGLVVLVLAAVVIGIALLETTWAKERLRGLMVRQANEYLNATLNIGRLGGSIVRGLELSEVNLSRDGRTLVNIDQIALNYSIRELLQPGTVIRRIRLTRPQFALAKQPDGRWDIAALIRRERQEGRQSGPGRPIEIQSIEILDGRVQLHDPLEFGATHVPTRFEQLNASFSFIYQPVRWRLDFANLSWNGRAPDLSVRRMTGTIANGSGGWRFDRLAVTTDRSQFEFSGRIIRGDAPTTLDLTVHAARFAFQEWAGVLRGLRNIGVEASFDTRLQGALAQLGTDIRLTGSGGDVRGHLTLDTTVPGWRGAGALDIANLDLARWLNDAARTSNITGHVAFDLALELGRHFPRGVYTFKGPHAMYMNYAADNVDATGQITAASVNVSAASATAYGARVTLENGSIGVDSPFPYRFRGRVDRIDLRNVPVTVPVPRVESLLTFGYDVTGQFSHAFIVGSATFGESTFLGATVGAGTIGTVDSSVQPIHFSGDGEIANVVLRRFGEGLDVGWMREPRYAGDLTGRFHVDVRGTDRESLVLAGGGRLRHANMFGGLLSDAGVSVSIDRGTLRAHYDGNFHGVDPAIAFDDHRWEAKLSGSGNVSTTVRDLLNRDVVLDDYDVGGSFSLQSSTVRGLTLDRSSIEASLHGSQLTIAQFSTAGTALTARGTGTVGLTDRQESAFDYQIERADLQKLRDVLRTDLGGIVQTGGRVTGLWERLRVTGDTSAVRLEGFETHVMSLTGHYDATFAMSDPESVNGRFDGHADFLTLSGQNVEEASGTVTVDGRRFDIDVAVAQTEQRRATIRAALATRLSDHAIDISALSIGLARGTWRLQRGDGPVTVRWDETEVAVTPAMFVPETGSGRITVAGSWRADGAGSVRITGSEIPLDALQSGAARITYGGVMQVDATLRGTRERPLITATVTVANGHVDRVAYDRFAGRVDYDSRVFTVDARIDQAPGIWITAQGSVPAALFDRSRPEQPIDLRVKSSGISLALVEGATAVVNKVSGQLLLDVHAVGTSSDPHFTGAVSIDNGAFSVTSTGAQYKNVRVGLTLAADRIAVDVFHVEDADGRPLDLRGSLGTHELQVGDLAVDIIARRFTILRNEFGRMDVATALGVAGRWEAPTLTGEITIASGDIKVDEVLQRTLLQPYATEPTNITQIDAVAALNPWQRLGLNITVHVPNTLRLVGDSVQLSPGTPVGVGDINLRAAGDLYLYKGPGEPMYITGSFDTISGTFAFQGRRFDIDPASSIIFRGDLNPDLYVGVTRVISGVQTRVGVIGPLRQPELRLSSVPPLDESDILSLIVFNTSTNQLTAAQQQELVVRAGALAAGFLATPIMSAISNEIGLDVLELEPTGDFSQGPKLTVGQELAPGLVARFSRTFGPEAYDEATVEYYLSRILRLRGTFSDAQSLSARSPFRRVERAGIDLLFFFSF